MARCKAVRHYVGGQERYFVIPDDAKIEDLIIEEPRTMSLDVIAQTPTFEAAGKIAFAMNRALRGELENAPELAEALSQQARGAGRAEVKCPERRIASSVPFTAD
jgi:hypothetical protein